ncbi:transcription initiation factor TFIIH subunit 2 [Cladophialophora psammophila CBS 110553]|uniref:General transcription and DNA repair factor IIH n=1 Tax=Cladophialophora psammophila CBS 110553 TaxID=1182543 RepID=W9WP25_9EURO|nr:transcription initiation factor TFIIH subunit 2 [Cladophialophora psammophila CBS 110553]EXJ69922.1 transcription initiation factor TFIIH subunit 2 [Cladophialophora psammophila CBS 110553]
MPASGDEYVADGTDDDLPRASTRGRSAARRANARESAQSFEVTRTWDLLVEGADGTITGAVEGLLEAGKRKRLLKDTTPLQRGIIRHLILILDMSLSMNEKDLRPTRYLLTLSYTESFIREFFEQNPISQLGIIGMRDGIAVRISDMSGNPTSHLAAIQKYRKEEPKGNPSLENALEMARAGLFHAPSHGTREILLVFGALHTSDPGDIHNTINSLVHDKIRATVIGLAAQVAICAELVSKTNDGDLSPYGVVLHEQHFRELYMAVTTPPITHDGANKTASSLLMMGFPSRTVEGHPSLCACHATPRRDGYLCSRCSAKVCSLPSECPVCGLTLILSTHLARSYHHLFPLVNWLEVPWSKAYRSTACFACLKHFPPVPKPSQLPTSTAREQRPGHRYECPVCRRHFCIDCDLFAHEVVHNCPGCQSAKIQTSLMGETEMPAPDRGEADGERNGTQQAGTEGQDWNRMNVD